MTAFATQGGFRAPVSPSAQDESVKVDRKLSYKFGMNPSSKSCLVCNGMHQLWNCEQFKNKSYNDRIRIVRDARLCENCFKIGHMAKGCMQRSGCYVKGCGRRHMTVLHPPVEPSPNAGWPPHRTNQEVSAAEKSSLSVSADLSHVIGTGVNSQNSAGHTANKVSLRILPVRVRGNQPGRMIETYALLDNGSDVTLCDRELVDELGITRQPRSFLLTTQESKDSERSGLEVKLIIDSIDEDSSLEVPRAWTVDRLNISECSIPKDHDVYEWPHLNGIELSEIDSKEVRVLIGCNVPEAFWVLVAIRSLLGWTLIGPTVKVKEEGSFNGSIDCQRIAFSSSCGKVSNTSDETPKCVAEVLGENILFLIDSGVAANIVSKTIYEMIKDKVILGKPIRLLEGCNVLT
ncbi:hypothetical protein P5673_026007 [Acropora cervicornis]|uniref:CCHC-type domain-containing protein n=1 Tax=Acropora cervicornis TaxID=6130 RepID=A0AAD9Q1C4_ACRCE|nr:hypothetical protein P5673_026007 [Acropora cervicornis]